MTTAVALDIGSGYVKAAKSLNGRGKNGEDFIVFSSAVGRLTPADLQRFHGDGLKGVVRCGDEVWLTGENAPSVVEHIENTRSDDWAGSSGWYALLYAALARLGIYSGKIYFVTGVPQKTWSVALRDSMVEALVGRHTAVVDDRTLDIEILPARSMIIPQAYAGMAWLVDNDRRLIEVMDAGGMIGGIDVGTYTSGYVLLDEGRLEDKCSGGVHDIGVWQLARTMIRLLDRDYNFRPSVHKVMSYLLRPTKAFIANETRDITPLIHEAAREVVSPLLEVLSSSWQDRLRGLEIVVYGGGAKFFIPAIKEAFPNARLAEGSVDSQRTPVNGMLHFFASKNGLEAEVV